MALGINPRIQPQTTYGIKGFTYLPDILEGAMGIMSEVRQGRKDAVEAKFQREGLDLAKDKVAFEKTKVLWDLADSAANRQSRERIANIQAEATRFRESGGDASLTILNNGTLADRFGSALLPSGEEASDVRMAKSTGMPFLGSVFGKSTKELEDAGLSMAFKAAPDGMIANVVFEGTDEEFKAAFPNATPEVAAFVTRSQGSKGRPLTAPDMQSYVMNIPAAVRAAGGSQSVMRETNSLIANSKLVNIDPLLVEADAALQEKLKSSLENVRRRLTQAYSDDEDKLRSELANATEVAAKRLEAYKEWKRKGKLNTPEGYAAFESKLDELTTASYENIEARSALSTFLTMGDSTTGSMRTGGQNQREQYRQIKARKWGVWGIGGIGQTDLDDAGLSVQQLTKKLQDVERTENWAKGDDALKPVYERLGGDQVQKLLSPLALGDLWKKGYSRSNKDNPNMALLHPIQYEYIFKLHPETLGQEFSGFSINPALAGETVPSLTVETDKEADAVLNQGIQ